MKSLKIAAVLLLIFASHLAFALNPSKEYKVKPDKYGMTYKEEKIPTKDGATLNSWFFELPKKTTNWVVMSASGDGNMADNLEIANNFLSAGWNVCMYDYRGYGASSDFKVDSDVYIYPQFAFDLNAVLDYLRKSRAIQRFDMYGQGIGAGLTLGVGAGRVEARKLIGDGPWPGLEPMKKKIKEKMGKDVVMPFGYDKNNEPMYGLAKSMPHLKGVMAIVSPNDPLVTPMEMKLISGITDLYVVKSSPDNAGNFSTDKDAYFARVRKFLSMP